MKFKGTKGEWILSVNSSYPEVRVLDYGNRVFGAAIMLHNDENDVLVNAHHSDENIANAKLIAAAPDLLEALQTYLNAGSKEQRRQASVIAKKAIEKALS